MSLKRRLQSILDCRSHMYIFKQCAMKVVCDSLGLVNFAIWLVNSVLNLKSFE